MTKDKLKHKLKSSLAIRKQIDAHYEQLQQLRATATKITPSYNLAPSGGGECGKVENAVLQIYDLEQQINSDIVRMTSAVQETYKFINLLDDEVLRLVIQMRYINHKSWERIAAELGYSCRQIHRLHNKALNVILKILNKKS